MQQFCSKTIIAILLSCCCASSLAHAAVTPEQRAKIKELSERTAQAFDLYSNDKLFDAAESVGQIQGQLIELMKNDDAALHRLVRPLYTKLSRLHESLEFDGADLRPLPSWEDLVTGKATHDDASAPEGVSFKTQIAPWLVTACGNCHINNQRGQFSLATYNDLMKGPPEGVVIFPGKETGNRIVEVIESGDMPRGNGKVTPEQLASLKQWIVDGAKFDGPDPAVAIASFAGTASPTPTPEVKVQMATGKETVSFARDIAPILKANCNGCHIAGRQASGNLRMDNFDQLLRGGDSGPVVAKANPDDSLLVKKLLGTAGQRMPAGGRPALPNEQIELISTWIREGATFDGPSSSSNIDEVISIAWAADASHTELSQRRQERSRASWTRVLPNDQPTSAGNTEVFVLGNITPARLDGMVKHLTEATAIVKKQLNAPEDQPLIKGGLAVFVLKSRYDYSEFGRMTENRELPKVWLGHWQANPLDVYGVMAGDADIPEDQLKSLSLQIATGAYLGSLNGTPTWFAEGVARNLVSSNFRRSDPRVKQWQAGLPAANQRIDEAKTLIDGRLDEEAAGVVGMALTQFMMERTNRRRFDKLLELLRNGQDFNEALTTTYAPPEILIKNWLGK